MESFPKIITSYPKKDESSFDSKEESTYVNCNICRNFSNVLNPNHRRSKDHQKKLTLKLRATKSKVKKFGLNAVSVHDEDWEKSESWYCYFCDKSLKKHEINNGLMIETLGYISHLASPEHAQAVKRYLKYHEREENFEEFCKTEEQFKKFTDKIPEAREKYLKKLEILNMKDVQSIRDVEEQRKKLVEEATQSSLASVNEDSVICQDQSPHSSNVMPYGAKACSHTSTKKLKVPPWQVGEQSAKQHCSVPVIGPTMETLMSHVANEKKKKLPAKRLGANLKRTEYSANWLPSFRGVWKGKRKQPKSQQKGSF